METETAETSISLSGRLAGVFFSPGRVFQSLRSHPSYLPPVLIAVVITLIAVYLMAPLNAKFAVDQARQQNPNMSEEQIAQMQTAMSGSFVLVIGIVGAIVGPPISLLIFTFLFRTIFQMFIGGAVSFKQALSVVSYSNLVMLLGFCAALPLILTNERPDMSLNLGLLAPFLDEKSIGYRFLKSIDIITGWWMAVLSIGFGALYEIETARAAKIFVSLWVLWIVLKTALGALLGQWIPGL